MAETEIGLDEMLEQDERHLRELLRRYGQQTIDAAITQIVDGVDVDELDDEE